MSISSLAERLWGWLLENPMAGLLFLLAILVWTVYRGQQEKDAGSGFWDWIRRLIGSSAFFLAVLLVAGFIHLVLTTASRESRAFFESGVQQRLDREASAWGKGFMQDELRVTQFETVEDREIIESPDPSAPPRTVTRQIRREVLQNGILETKGEVKITRSHPERRARGENLFNSFFVSARFEYTVVNNHTSATEAEFLFPLSPDAEIYDSLRVFMDGKDLDSELQIRPKDGIAWKAALAPGQEVRVVVEYASRGLDWYFYRVPQPRELGVFLLTITADTTDADFRTSMDSSAINIHVNKDADTGTWTATWSKSRGDKAIMAPQYGLWFKTQEQPYQPYWRFPPVLDRAVEGAIWFLGIGTLTLFLSGCAMSSRLALMWAAVIVTQSVTLIGLGSASVPFYAAYGISSILAAGLLILTLAYVPKRITRVLILLLWGLFLAGFPLVELTIEPRIRGTLYEGFYIGAILYLFFFSLISIIRRWHTRNREKASAAG
ncbi:MAG: hypothetical protein WBM17_16985 [Anaerolineales bacterium]